MTLDAVERQELARLARSVARLEDQVRRLSRADRTAGMSANAARIGPLLIQFGYVDPVDVSAAVQTVTVPFPEEFSGVPEVFPVLVDGLTVAQPRLPSIVSRSATEFVAKQNWYDGSSHSMGIPFSWVAFGPA